MPVAIYERAECEEMAGCAVGQAALAVGSVAVDETFSEACAAADGTNVFHDGKMSSRRHLRNSWRSSSVADYPDLKMDSRLLRAKSLAVRRSPS